MSTTSTTKQENSPPKWATPLFEQSATEASNLYNSGVGGRTYMGSTVAPLSGATMGAANNLYSAGNAWDTSGTRGTFGALGSAAVSNPYMNQLSAAANGVKSDNVQTEGDWRGLLDRAQAPTAADQYLQPYASGEYVRNGNPHFEDMLSGQLGKTAAQVQSSMSGAGRYGSGANVGVLSSELGNIRSNALYNQFNQDQQNQLQAVGMTDAARQSALGMQGNAISGITGVQTGNADRSLAAQGLRGNMLSNAGNMYSTGIGQGLQSASAMSDIDQRNFQNRLAGAGAQLQAGGIADRQNQAELSDYINQWYAKDNEDWTRLGMLQAAASGAAGPYGTQVSQSRQPFNPTSLLGAMPGMK